MLKLNSLLYALFLASAAASAEKIHKFTNDYKLIKLNLDGISTVELYEGEETNISIDEENGTTTITNKDSIITIERKKAKTFEKVKQHIKITLPSAKDIKISAGSLNLKTKKYSGDLSINAGSLEFYNDAMLRSLSINAGMCEGKFVHILNGCILKCGTLNAEFKIPELVTKRTEINISAGKAKITLNVLPAQTIAVDTSGLCKLTSEAKIDETAPLKLTVASASSKIMISN